MSYTESPFYKEHLSANQKSLPLRVQKLWPIMWFSLIFLKSRDVKTWRTSKRSDTHGSGILWGTFCHQPEVSATSGSKVMAHYLIFTKVVTLTLPFDRFSIFFVRIVLGLEDTFCQKIRTIGPAVWSVQREKTDRQTNKQTDRPRWPIYFAKIEDFSQSNNAKITRHLAKLICLLLSVTGEVFISWLIMIYYYDMFWIMSNLGLVN